MLQAPSPIEQPWERQTLRVPRDDRTLFCRPEWERAADAANDNRTLLNGAEANIQGRTLKHLREWTARSVLPRAIEFTGLVAGESVKVPECGAKASFVVSGHQPSLFHPGVWVKNFAIDALAKQTGRIGLNLIVDNDVLSSTSIRVPTGTREAPRVVDIAFDAAQPARPWEEAAVADLPMFRSFGDRVSALMAGWGVRPLIADIWPDAVETAESGVPLPACLTAARHRLERRWGLRNLELPLSRLCECDPFLWFAGHLFACAERFRDVHNAALQQFRSINRVRSRTHPVPELSSIEDWTETPFWIWSTADPRRRKAFVRTRGRETELFDGREVVARFPLNPQMDACCAVEALRELPERGIRLRTRALTTTLFARLCLGDVFLHGIGGAKYDELTDRIIARFFGIPAPEFVTMSATVNLPLAEPFDITTAELRRLQHRLRDVRFNPERMIESQAIGRRSGSWRELLREKQALIAEQNAAAARGLNRHERRQRRGANSRRFRRLREIGASLAATAGREEERLEAEIADAQRRLAANQLLRNREFSFCLFPQDALRPFLTGMF